MNELSSVVSEIKVSYQPTKIASTPIRTSQDAYEIIRQYFDEDTLGLHESFLVMYLNQSNTPIGVHVHSNGGLTSTVVDIRLVLGVALKSASTGIILCHNHPSGALKPSQMDLTLTEKIRAGCKLLDIRLYDHLIISPQNSYYSFADAGDLFGISLNEGVS